MDPIEIHDLVKEWLCFVEEPTAIKEEEMMRMEVLLDRLAVARHSIDPVFEIDHGDAPPQDPAALRSLIRNRFPSLTVYNIPAEVTKNFGATTTHLGDAIDDLADITQELRDVDHAFLNTSDQNALYDFAWGYDHHWRYHLRALLLYMEMRRSEVH